MASPRTVRVTRYVTPLREGGSLPAIVEADDEGLYVLKFRGAGQGVHALIAELLAGEIARALGLPVPEIVFADVDADLARTEPDPEIRALVHRAPARTWRWTICPARSCSIRSSNGRPRTSRRASSGSTPTSCNVDRTPRNTNMLMWHRRLWLIDHGASLYFHHRPDGRRTAARAGDSFPMIKDHVLPDTARSKKSTRRWRRAHTDAIDAIVDMVPDAWLEEAAGVGAGMRTAAYRRYLTDRLDAPQPFVAEAMRAD